LAGYKRATNIIRIEEKRDARDYVGRPNPSLYRQEEEKALAGAIDTVRAEASAAVKAEDYEAAMRAMAKLRPYVDAFFEKVTVNVADSTEKKELRENRLKLLNQIRVATEAVADFSCIEGGFSEPSPRFVVHLPAQGDPYDHHRCPCYAARCADRRHPDPARAAAD